MGCSTNMGWYMGPYHGTMGADVVEERKGGMG